MSTQKVWITKYAMTKGILQGECEIYINLNGDIRAIGNNQHYKPTEFFYTENEAKMAAENMRTAKIRSLYRAAEKLEKLKF